MPNRLLKNEPLIFQAVFLKTQERNGPWEGTACGRMRGSRRARNPQPPVFQAGGAMRLRIRTRLYAAAAKVNIHPTLSGPRNLVLRCKATVFIQPNTSSTRFRFRWLIAYPG